jgi:hypothetical protein
VLGNIIFCLQRRPVIVQLALMCVLPAANNSARGLVDKDSKRDGITQCTE